MYFTPCWDVGEFVLFSGSKSIELLLYGISLGRMSLNGGEFWSDRQMT